MKWAKLIKVQQSKKCLCLKKQGATVQQTSYLLCFALHEMTLTWQRSRRRESTVWAQDRGVGEQGLGCTHLVHFSKAIAKVNWKTPLHHHPGVKKKTAVLAWQHFKQPKI